MFAIIKRWFKGQPKKRKPVAILVGHSRIIGGHPEGGARSVSGVSEHSYNLGLANKLQKALAASGVHSQIIAWYEGHGYTSAMNWLSSEVQKMDACCAIELHFNAASPGANGHEWIYWHTSDEGMALAYAIDVAFMKALPELKQRGIKPVRGGDRGAQFCRKIHCPAVIAEPFFGSNEMDWEVANVRKDEIAAAIARGIKKWMP